MLVLNLAILEEIHILRYFSSDQITCIGLDFLFVFLFLYCVLSDSWLGHIQFFLYLLLFFFFCFVSYPAQVFYFLKDSWHGQLKIFVIGDRVFAVCGILVNGLKDTVEDTHDEIIVVTGLAIDKLSFGDIDEIILKLIKTVDFLHSLL